MKSPNNKVLNANDRSSSHISNSRLSQRKNLSSLTCCFVLVMNWSTRSEDYASSGELVMATLHDDAPRLCTMCEVYLRYVREYVSCPCT